MLSIDGKPYRFLGKPDLSESYVPEGEALRQTSLRVTPTSTVYTFSHPACELRVTFLSPLLADRLEILSRPVSYLFYEIKPRGEGHRFEVYFDLSADFCGDDHGQKLICRAEEGHVWMGNEEQNVLHESGDDVRIDWGYLHLVHPGARLGTVWNRLVYFKKRVSPYRLKTDMSQPIPHRQAPILYTTSEKLSDCFVVAYDDIHSVEFFHRPVDCYYQSVYGNFGAMLACAVKEADEVRALCEAFDRKFSAKLRRISPDYAEIGALTYRQAIAAHKLVTVDGKLMFFSKENFSNGCMATLDVTYPSIPLFLALNPELVRGMMRPLLDYARTPEWRFDFAPHDCGRYPLCNGQVYSTENGVLVEKNQMPVEECGNAILTVAAAAAADGDRTFAEENRDLLTGWANYLLKHGYCPENQLCTDDFAGHLANNCNLSLKAIVALGAFAKLYNAPEYATAAREMADRWTKEAKRSAGGYRLTFDRDDSWSMKYNVVWDRLLGLGLFAPGLFREEIAVYKQMMNRYGVPLDCRADYTKNDWMAWTTVMTDDRDYTDRVYGAIRRFICETGDRVPVSDWYDTKDARQVGFQARSVVGGLFINLLPGKLKHLGTK